MALKNKVKTLLIIPDKDNCKLLVDVEENRREMFSYGLKFLPLNQICEWFEKNFDINYGTKKQKDSFFIKTNAYDIIKEYKEFKKIVDKQKELK